MTTDTETCEGFSNYPTFAIAVFIDNDEGELNDMIRYVIPACNTGRDLRGCFTDKAPILEGYWADLLTYSLDMVNWQELYEHWSDNDKEE